MSVGIQSGAGRAGAHRGDAKHNAYDVCCTIRPFAKEQEDTMNKMDLVEHVVAETGIVKGQTLWRRFLWPGSPKL